MRKRKVASNPNEEIGDYMVSPVLSIAPDAAAQEAAQLMESKHIGSLLVKEGETFVGIITETDLTRKIVAQGLQDKNPRATIFQDPFLSDTKRFYFNKIKEIANLPLLPAEKRNPLLSKII